MKTQKTTGRYPLTNGDYAEVVAITEPPCNGPAERYIAHVYLHKATGQCVDVTEFALCIDETEKLLATCL